jgi:branched-chain amino acid transport system substrate-binding protein
MLKAYNKRVPIEVIEYDDRSSTEEAVRAPSA